MLLLYMCMVLSTTVITHNMCHHRTYQLPPSYQQSDTVSRGDGAVSVADSAADLPHPTTTASTTATNHNNNAAHHATTDSDFVSVCSELPSDHGREGPPGPPSAVADTDDLTDAAESLSDMQHVGSWRQSSEGGTAALSRSSSTRHASFGAAGGKEEGRGVVHETWMLMELCDMGTLVVWEGVFVLAV